MMGEIADILDKAADLIEPEGAWSGFVCDGPNCAATAIDDVAQTYRASRPALVYFAKFLGSSNILGGIWKWNDAPERTQAEVVAKLREAASKARGEQRSTA